MCVIVDHGKSVERRVVKVSPGDQNLLEVVDGLGEGEMVVLEPTQTSPNTTRWASGVSEPKPSG